MSIHSPYCKVKCVLSLCFPTFSKQETLCLLSKSSTLRILRLAEELYKERKKVIVSLRNALNAIQCI
jgi:hypothetical protein